MDNPYFARGKKYIIHQISLTGTGGMQRSFAAYYRLAREKSYFNHRIFGVHKIEDDYIFLTPDYVNISRSIKGMVSFLYYLINDDAIIHLYNNLGSRNVHRILKGLPSKRVIFHERGGAWNISQENRHICVKNAAKADIILANSCATKIMLVEKFGISPEKIKILYNGFLNPQDITPFVNSSRSDGRIRVGFLGRLDLPKGVHIFAKLARILAKKKDILFIIGGRGFLEDYLKNEIMNIDNVEYRGKVEDSLEFLKGLDLLIVPSIREPLGNVIIEAGYLKKPVIASNIDGIPEIIDNGVSGILINPTESISLPDFPDLPLNSSPMPEYVVDPVKKNIVQAKELNVDRLEDAVISLLNDKDKMKSLGESLYKKVISKFTLNNYFDNLEDIYKDIFDIKWKE